MTITFKTGAPITCAMLGAFAAGALYWMPLAAADIAAETRLQTVAIVQQWNGRVPDGAAALDRPAAELMTSTVVTCQPDTTVEELMNTMTDRRIRHVPVVVDGALTGLISIGDVVKDRISGLEAEKQVLHDYIAHPY